jgi:hypothetical protein
MRTTSKGNSARELEPLRIGLNEDPLHLVERHNLDSWCNIKDVMLLNGTCVSLWSSDIILVQHLCGDKRVRTLLYEAANVMVTRYKGQLKLKDWALAIAKRSTGARPESLWLAASRSSCTRCCGTGPSSYRPSPRTIHETGGRIQLPRGATP